DVPLTVAQLVDQAILGLFRRDLKGLVESAVGASHAQGGIKRQERFAHRVHDVLRVGLDLRQQSFGASPLGYVFHRQDQELGMSARAELASIEQHDLTPNGGEVVLKLEVVED